MSQLSQLNWTLELLWRRIENGLALSGGHLDILVIRYRGGSLGSMHLRTVTDRRCLYVRRFLEQKLEQLGDSGNRIRILESDRFELDEHKLRRIDVLLVPLSIDPVCSRSSVKDRGPFFESFAISSE